MTVKTGVIQCILFLFALSGVARASLLLQADFELSPIGSISAAGLNAGTMGGQWVVNVLEESEIESDGSGKALLAARGSFDLQLELDTFWTIDGSTVAEFSFDMASRYSGSGRRVYVAGFDAASNELFRITYDDDRLIGCLDASGGFTSLGGTGFNEKVTGISSYDASKMAKVTLRLGLETYDLLFSKSALSIADQPYNTSGATNLAFVTVSGLGADSGAYLDNVRLTTSRYISDVGGVLSPKARVWETVKSAYKNVTLQDDLVFQAGTGTNDFQITVHRDERYQSIDGFGASMTDTSAILIHNSPHRDEIMRQLFDPESGIGLSVVRIPMGACDFSTNVWSYEDVQGSFSIDPDRPMRLPLLKQALELNPALKIMASPWSAPAWMKVTGTMKGGGLRTDMYQTYAMYFVHFIQAYEAEGIPVWAVTAQNEPQHSTTSYPSMLMSPAEHAELIKAMGRAFATNGIQTKIIAFDHNYDIGEDYVNSVYADAEAYGYLAGSAWHQYGGNASSMGAIYGAYPDKGVYFTERTGSRSSFGGNFGYFMGDIFYNALKNGAKTALAWNIAVDENGGPHLPTVTWDGASGLVQYPSTNDTYKLYGEYAALGQYAKCVKPGAVRLGVADQVADGLLATAFKNTDGTIGVVVYNKSGSGVSFDVNCGGQYVSYSMYNKAAVSILFHELDDVDGNELPDEWEFTHFETTGIDPDDDPDADGFSNREEYVEGTNPLDREDHMKVVFEDGVERLRVSPIVFSEFRQWGVGTSTNLNDWVSLDAVSVSNAPGEKIFELPNVDTAAGFYRGQVAFPSLD